MLPSEQAQSILERLHQLERKSDLPRRLIPFVEEIDHLLSRTYQLVSELDCQSRTQPQNAEARNAYRTFLAESYPPIDAAYQQCLHLALPHFQAFPDDWKPAFAGELDREPESPGATQLKGDILEQASHYHSIAAGIAYPQPEGSAGLTQQLRDPDRAVRQHAYLQLHAAEDGARRPWQELFSRLHRDRQRLAEQAGFTHYLDYHHATPSFRARQLDPAELRRLRWDVLQIIRPLLTQIRQRKAQWLGVTELRPWDQSFTPSGTVINALPHNPEALLDAVTLMLQGISPPMVDAFDQLRKNGKFHVASASEAPRAPYTFLLPEERLAWMTVSYDATANSVFQVLHETGHCLHYTLMPADSLLAQRQPPREYREFAAHSMELLSLKHLDLFFQREDIPAAADTLLEKALQSIVSACILDEFQEKIYSRRFIQPDEINSLYQELLLKYPTGICLEGLLEQQGTGWASWQMFSAPFYGLEYALAWIAALTQETGNAGAGPLRIYVQRFDRPLHQMFTAAGSLLLPSTERLESAARQLSEQLMIT